MVAILQLVRLGGRAFELPLLGLLERVVVEEVTLHLRGADAELSRRQRLEHLEIDVAVRRDDLPNALPERVVRVVGSDSLEEARERRASVLRARLQSHPGSRRRERREVADERPLRLVLHLRLERPARLEQVAQVARLPAANLERKRAAGVERAAARRPGRVGDLASREVARDAPARVGLGNRPEQRLRVRVLRILVDRLRRADLDDPAEIEDRDAVAEELRGREVVRDVEVREVEARA